MSKLYQLIIFALILLLSCNIMADKERNNQNQPFKIIKINIVVNDIYFDKDKIWFQDFANHLHINTKEHVILNLLPFKEGDQITASDLDEAERLLRTQHFLRDAKITSIENGVVNVVVYDTWSLFPTASFSHSENKTKSSIGLRDSNLLGLGIETTLKYRFDPDRKGYRLRVATPINYFPHSTANVIFEEYDVGQIRELSFEKPFYTNDSATMFEIKTSFENIETIVYHNNDTLGIINSQTQIFSSDYGWLESINHGVSTRQLLGVSSYNREILENTINEYQDDIHSRDQLTVWWGKEYFKDDFEIHTNINVMSNKEDINFGYKAQYKIGLGQTTFSNLNTEANISTKLSYAGGAKFGELLILQELELLNEFYEKSKQYYSLNYQANIFYPLQEQLILFSGNQISYVNQYLNEPQSLGGDSGLRGYPTQYQHGKKRWLSNLELRYYPGTDLWKSFTFGWAAFFDAGKAWDTLGGLNNISDKTLTSIGLGMRIFPKVASGHNVIHIDLVKPLADDPELSNWEWRVEVKSSF